MDWLETWRDSWSTGSATASSSSSSAAARGGNDQEDAHDDTRAAPANAGGGKKRKQELLATTASPPDEPRRTKRARKPTAALADFRIELDTRQDRNDASKQKSHERPTRVNLSKGSGGVGTSESGKGTQQGEETAGSWQLPMHAGKFLWTPAEDARLRTAVLTLAAGKNSTIANNTSGRTKVTVKPVEWPEVKRIFDGLAPPVPGGMPAPSRSERSLQHRFDVVLSPLYQHAAPVTAPVAEAPSPGSQWLVSPTPCLNADGTSSSATPAAINADAVSQHACRSATLLAQIERRMKASAPKGLGDGSGFGTSDIGNGTEQLEDTVGSLQQQPKRAGKVPWTPAEEARLRTAVLTFAKQDPANSNNPERIKLGKYDWPHVKQIFDGLAPASLGTPATPRSVHSLRGHWEKVVSPSRRQQAPPATVPAEAGPSPSGSQWFVSAMPSSSAAAIPSGSAGTNIVEEDSRRASRSATYSGQDERREESAPPNQAATVASFDTAAATAFSPESEDPMSGSPTLTNAPATSIASGSTTAPAIMPSQNVAAAPAVHLVTSTPCPEGSNTSHHQKERRLLSGSTCDAQGSANAQKGASIGRPAESNPTSEANGTPEAGTSGPAATSFTPPGNVNSSSSASARIQVQPAASGGGQATGPFTGTEDARIIELYNLRIPQTHIAKALNRSSSSLYARIGILRQLGLISRPQPRKQPALGASDKSTEPSPATITQDAQQTVASSSHSTLVPASSSSMAVPVSQAPVHDPQVGPSISDTTPSAPQNRSNSEAATRKRFTAEEDRQIVELRASGMGWQVIGSRLQRTTATCGRRYTLLKEKAKLAGQDLSSYVQLPKPVAAGGQAGETFTAPPPSIATPVQQPAATTAPLPPYTVEDDTIILRMYLQGNSAERIGIAIQRSAFSVHRRWTKKKDGWIAAGLLTAGSRLKLRDDPPDRPVVSATTESPIDSFADLRAPSTNATSVQQDPQEPIGSPASRTPTLEPETRDNDLGGFDSSFFSYEDMVVDPALLGIRAEPMSDAAGEATTLQLQNPAAAILGSRRESPLVPSASEDDSSTPETTTEKMLAGAMPHYDPGMQGLDRFLRLVKDGGKKKR